MLPCLSSSPGCRQGCSHAVSLRSVFSPWRAFSQGSTSSREGVRWCGWAGMGWGQLGPSQGSPSPHSAVLSWAPHQPWIFTRPPCRHQAWPPQPVRPHLLPPLWGQHWHGPCVSWHPAGGFAFFRHFPPDRNGVKMELGEAMSPVPGERALRALRRLLGVSAIVGDEEDLFPTSLWGFWYTPLWPPYIFRGYMGCPQPTAPA